MSRYPFPVAADHQRTMSSSNNSDNIPTAHHNTNGYGHFHEGHVPAYADNADWNLLRDPSKQSTGSVSSFKSWTSEDPAFSSRTSSLSQYTPPTSQQLQLQLQHHQSPLSKSYRPPAAAHQQHRGESLSMASTSSSGRYRSNSNQSNTSQQSYIHHQSQHPHSHNYQQFSESNHANYTSQPTSHSQQQQHQHREPRQQYQESPRSSQRTQRRRDPSATTEEPNLRSLDDYEAMLQQMTSPNLGPRARGELRSTAAGAANTSATVVVPSAATEQQEQQQQPSLDDFEAMLQEMTSPNLGPRPRGESVSTSGSAAARRQQEREIREARADRIARQTRRQQQQQQQQPQELKHTVSDQSQQDESQHMRAPLGQDKQEFIEADPALTTSSFEERKLRRRSSLPSKLKSTPNMFANLQRRNSGSQRLSPVVASAESPSLHTLIENNDAPPLLPYRESVQAAPSMQGQYGHLPALQAKRFSWESESVAPRVDLLQSTTGMRPESMQRKGSWQTHQLPGEAEQHLQQDQDQYQHQHLNQNQHQQYHGKQELDIKRNSARLSQQDANRPPLTTKSHLRLSNSLPVDQIQNAMTMPRSQSPLPMTSSEAPVLNLATKPKEHSSSSNDSRGERSVDTPPPSHQARPVTPNSRPTPSTPVGAIRLPLGPAPPTSASSASTSGTTLSHKASPRSGKRSNSNASVAGNSMLQPPLVQASRPRAGSAASMNSNGSMNGYILDRAMTPPPPPPSLPLPSLPLNAHAVGTGRATPPPPPPPASNHGLSGADVSAIGLGITQAQAPIHTRNVSLGGGRDFVNLPAPQLVLLQNENQIALPTPASSLPMSPELNAVAANQAAHMARLKKRVSSLEKELATTEMELSTRIRDGSELQTKVDQLMSERNLLERKLAEMTSSSSSTGLSPTFSEGQDATGLSRHLIGGEDRASLQLQHDQELKQAVKQVQVEKEELFEAMMQRQDRSRTEMVSQMESLRVELAQRDVEILKFRTEQEEQSAQHMTRGQESEISKRQEVERLTELQSKLELELNEAQVEIQRLQGLMEEAERNHAEDKQTSREELESRHEQRTRDQESAYSELEQQVQSLALEKQQHEESFAALEQELQAFQERSQQEAAQYRTLQDSVQRLSSKMARLETQHENDLQQLHLDHEEVLDRTVQEHENGLSQIVERTRREVEQEMKYGQVEAEAREKVLRDRIQEQSGRDEELEEEVFRLQKALEASEKEKEILARTNRSLERHLSMQHLQEQENLFKLDELERENNRLREVLKDLNIAAALKSKSRKDGGNEELHHSDAEIEDEEEEEEKTQGLRAEEMFEEQQRKWAEQTELMARKLARAEEEARKAVEQNESLRIKLELQRQASVTSKSSAHSKHQEEYSHEELDQDQAQEQGQAQGQEESLFLRPSTPVLSPPLSD